MGTESKTKKRIVISYKNLSDELLEELKRQYPLGYQDKMIRVDKGPGDFFYAVVLETADISYLVKVDVKIDSKIDEEEEDDKDYFEDDMKDADSIVDSDEEPSDDM